MSTSGHVDHLVRRRHLHEAHQRNAYYQHHYHRRRAFATTAAHEPWPWAWTLAEALLWGSAIVVLGFLLGVPELAAVGIVVGVAILAVNRR